MTRLKLVLASIAGGILITALSLLVVYLGDNETLTKVILWPSTIILSLMTSDPRGLSAYDHEGNIVYNQGEGYALVMFAGVLLCVLIYSILVFVTLLLRRRPKLKPLS